MASAPPNVLTVDLRSFACQFTSDDWPVLIGTLATAVYGNSSAVFEHKLTSYSPTQGALESTACYRLTTQKTSSYSGCTRAVKGLMSIKAHSQHCCVNCCLPRSPKACPSQKQSQPRCFRHANPTEKPSVNDKNKDSRDGFSLSRALEEA